MFSKSASRYANMLRHEGRGPVKRCSASGAKRANLFVSDQILGKGSLSAHDLIIGKIGLPSERRASAFTAVVTVTDSIECWLANDFD